MPYDAYWHGNSPEELREYREADILRQRMQNERAWLNGVYIVHAIQATVGNMTRKQGEEPFTYPKRPLPFTKEEIEQHRQIEEENELLKAEIYMLNFVRAGKDWGKN